MQKIFFDLHSDTLTECFEREININDNSLQFSIDKIPPDLKIVQCLAVYMPDKFRGDAAFEYFLTISDLFFKQIEKFSHQVGLVEKIEGIPSILADKKAGLILTIEGGSALAGRLDTLDIIKARDVKMITLTWNTANELSGCVNDEQGFTDFGRSAVARMEELDIVADVSHLSEKGFYQLCEFAKKPFAASHSNSRAICNHKRNLTDDMFCEISRRGGVVGLTYCDKFVRVNPSDCDTVDDFLRHIHHFLALGGEDTIALGSDFDGANMPPYIKGVDKLEELYQSVVKSGISEQVAEKIFFENANRFFGQTQNKQ